VRLVGRIGRAYAGLSLVMRASDEDRERAIGKLRRAYHTGELSTDTFEERVGHAVAGHDAAALARLTADVHDEPPSGVETMLLRSRRAIRKFWDAVWTDPAVLEAPPPAQGSFAIGRSANCNRVFDDRTVSRLHAQLRWVNGGWVLSDLGSMNGTWVNGWRIDEAWIRDGDRVQLGAVRLRFKAPR
jgi:hypothetical protein